MAACVFFLQTWYDSMLSRIDDWLKMHPQQSLKFIQFDTLQGTLEVCGPYASATVVTWVKKLDKLSKAGVIDRGLFV